MNESMRLRRAKAHLFAIRTWLVIVAMAAKLVRVARWIAVVGSVLATAILTPAVQIALQAKLATSESSGALKSLLGSIGGALIGATAIVFSLIMFSMQVNVERMPHGLFVKLSSDRKLLGAFFLSFAIALLVSLASLLPLPSMVGMAVATGVWGVVAIPLLFVASYRRALALINPSTQLALIVERTRADLHRWGRRANVAAPLIAQAQDVAPAQTAHGERSRDRAKLGFLTANHGWDRSTLQAVNYTFSYVVRFAEAGDYDVSMEAIHSLMRVNAAYCAVKNGAFRGSDLFAASGSSTDAVINTSLESLRKAMRTALARGDERMAESVMAGMSALLGVYLKIDYPGRRPAKLHATLAAGYLQSAVQSVVPHNMPDVMMEGMRILGRSAQATLVEASATEASAIGEHMALLSSVGIARSDHHPVTLTAFEQLALLSIEMVVRSSADRHPMERLRVAAFDAAQRFLATNDGPMQRTHANNLSPYFSMSSMTSLGARMTTVANELLGRGAGDPEASRIIGNIRDWSHEIHVQYRDLLVLAVNRRSSLTTDLLHLASGFTSLMLALSSAPACNAQTACELKQNALRLIQALAWMPGDQASVAFIAVHSVGELMFDAATDADRRGAEEVYLASEKLLLDWAIKGGSHETGWGILETTTVGLACLALANGGEERINRIKNQFTAALRTQGGPSLELRGRAADQIRRNVHQYARGAAGYSSIDVAAEHLDPARLRALLLELAEILEQLNQ